MSDLKYVNNKEFSDVAFLVEEQTFYAHKIVIVTGTVVCHSNTCIVVGWTLQFTVLNQMNGSGLQRIETTV